MGSNGSQLRRISNASNNIVSNRIEIDTTPVAQHISHAIKEARCPGRLRFRHAGRNHGVAQTYPTRPVPIVTTGAGGSPDFALRIIAPGLAETLGQQVVIDNRPSGFVSGEVVSKAAADGYTLVAGSDSFWIGPLMEKGALRSGAGLLADHHDQRCP